MVAMTKNPSVYMAFLGIKWLGNSIFLGILGDLAGCLGGFLAVLKIVGMGWRVTWQNSGQGWLKFQRQ